MRIALGDGLIQPGKRGLQREVVLQAPRFKGVERRITERLPPVPFWLVIRRPGDCPERRVRGGQGFPVRRQVEHRPLIIRPDGRAPGAGQCDQAKGKLASHGPFFALGAGVSMMTFCPSAIESGGLEMTWSDSSTPERTWTS